MAILYQTETNNNFPENFSLSSYLKSFSIGFTLIFAFAYAIIPYLYGYNIFPEYVSILMQITFLGVLTYNLSLNFGLGYTIATRKIVIDFDLALITIFSIFIFIVIVILVTANKIPLIESLRGADVNDLTQYREDFLKGREGWGASLGYIIGMINAYLLPYFIVLAFQLNHKLKYIVALIFFLYCISFLEKAYFLKLVLPIFFLYFFYSTNKLLFLIRGLIIISSLFFLMFILAGNTGFTTTRDEDFFSILYTPTGTIEAIIWRAGVVPIVSAIDAVRVFMTDFGGQFLLGKSSSLLAFISGSDQVNFERALYQTQFGGSDTGNANQFFLIEAYINYGYAGVIFFSFLVGKITRFIILQKNIALISILPMLLFNLFNAGLIGNLFSNGLLMFLIIVNFIEFKFRNK